MERQLLFNRFKEEVEKNTQFALKHFSNLGDAQFNWHAEPDVWSIGQCIQHINMISRHWHKQFSKVLKGGIKSANKGEYTPGFLGKYVLKVITPVVTKKFKTPNLFQPHFLVNGKVAMDEFLDFQKRFTDLAEKLRNYDLEKNKLNSTIYPVVHLKLGDAFEINNNHTARHLNQAFNVMNAPGFPKE
ncbi:MAG TPA: DinB family protein [Bacteroidia bacterium]|nr:DinB family protein [Bacteroidia bacterium]